mmetsp:Transcript_11601/g.38771  ORF Transcript_11601/g.38771 Transcript_11601/m.38771 type:complete len:218 (-) Transcript_11601:1414-2067(-)
MAKRRTSSVVAARAPAQLRFRRGAGPHPVEDCEPCASPSACEPPAASFETRSLSLRHSNLRWTSHSANFPQSRQTGHRGKSSNQTASSAATKETTSASALSQAFRPSAASFERVKDSMQSSRSTMTGSVAGDSTANGWKPSAAAQAAFEQLLAMQALKNRTAPEKEGGAGQAAGIGGPSLLASDATLPASLATAPAAPSSGTAPVAAFSTFPSTRSN